MPYKSTGDLPERVRKNLPKKAQKIFLEVFNASFKEYKDPSKRRGTESREETAMRVAWHAVKLKYHKSSSGKWVE